MATRIADQIFHVPFEENQPLPPHFPTTIEELLYLTASQAHEIMICYHLDNDQFHGHPSEVIQKNQRSAIAQYLGIPYLW